VGNGYFTRETARRLKKNKSILKKWLKEGQTLTPLLVQQAAWRGDKLSKKMWHDTGVHLGTYLAGLANLLNPERIVIGGGLAQSGSLLFGPLQRAFKKKAFPIAARSARVVKARLGVDAGLVGAAALILF
jgi:glucokinase